MKNVEILTGLLKNTINSIKNHDDIHNFLGNLALEPLGGYGVLYK